MKAAIRILFLSFCLFACTVSTAVETSNSNSQLSGVTSSKLNPNFEFSGVDNFWQLRDILKADTEPTEQQWATLFTTPGYAELFRREFNEKFFQKIFRRAYKPSLLAEKDSMIQKAKEDGGYWGWFTPAMFEALEYTDKNEIGIRAKVKSFETFAYTDLAIGELQTFLPEKVSGTAPAVSFIIFNDSRGYTPVVMSINKLFEEEVSLTSEKRERLNEDGYTIHRPHVLYFAHEFFHHYRDLKEEFVWPENGNADQNLIWNLNQITNEGIADQINIKQIMMPGQVLGDSKRGLKVQKEQALVVENIRKLDTVLVKISENPDQQADFKKELRQAVPRSGHPTGFYMANIILEQFGKDDLVSVVRNPFEFFLMYNRAAVLNKNAPIYSDKSIDYIKLLSARYAVN